MSVLKYIDEEQDARHCYLLMAQLRPHLATEDDFITCWQRQVAEGYRLVGLFENDCVVALSGFRVQENLVHGRFLYVDDLVTDQTRRSMGYGELLMTHLKQTASALGCVKLVLDTALSNTLGQRFYFRQGLLATSLRFGMSITS